MFFTSASFGMQQTKIAIFIKNPLLILKSPQNIQYSAIAKLFVLNFPPTPTQFRVVIVINQYMKIM